MPQGQEVAVDVTWQDQQHINTFGRLNRRLNDFKQQLAIKKVRPAACLFALLCPNVGLLDGQGGSSGCQQ